MNPNNETIAYPLENKAVLNYEFLLQNYPMFIPTRLTSLNRPSMGPHPSK